MNKLTTNIWCVQGYVSTETSEIKDNNFQTMVVMDERFDKDDVLYLVTKSMQNEYKTMSLSAELYGQKNICLEAEWIEEKEYYADEYSECNVRTVYRCSHCGHTTKYKSGICYCGAHMKERANNITPQHFYEKYCKQCGTQRCMGVDDEIMREGCAHYRTEMLNEP